MVRQCWECDEFSDCDVYVVSIRGSCRELEVREFLRNRRANVTVKQTTRECKPSRSEATKRHSELATLQARAQRDQPPRPRAEKVVCSLGAGWNLRGVCNHDTGHRLGSDFLPVWPVDPSGMG